MPVIYLHIPKTAGMSLRSYLVDQFPRDHICPAFGWQDLKRQHRVTPVDLIAGHFDVRLLTLLPPGPRQVITFLREPVARTVSAVHHATHDPAFRHHALDLKGRRVDDLLLDPDVMRFFANTQTAYLSSVDLDCPEPVTDGCLEELSFDNLIPDVARAIRNLGKMDFVGLTESFPSDLLILSDILGTYPPGIAPLLNAGEARSAAPPDLTPRQLRSVIEHNAYDLELYEHARAIHLSYRRRQRADILSDFLLKQPRETASIPFVSQRPFCGCGFLEEEADASGRPFRWSGTSDRSCLTFRITPGKMQVVRLELWLPGHPFAGSVRWSSDSRIRAVWSRRLGRRFTYLVQVIEEGKAWIDLTIEADRIAEDGRDLRKLGFVLMEAECFQGTSGYFRIWRFLARLAIDRVKRLCGIGPGEVNDPSEGPRGTLHCSNPAP